ncbi:unnamed protein product [Didymodactylos carnosus]|uniref:Uncharacterized protein n=1 Tax=Didymodactylos carnosus TaxID=1234261 RepID=A0A814YI76_9BILA|nr:unnamed protein product [Didymodactylos carnosus]CAF1230715.1 unnamed protein product [Didymodactylos carnosus]CAF3632109.1 unnamed protein product [Didymodactylos carnosus]CAF3993401.1 unnamed protein product [Didymodactylos carnosus]
MNKLWTGDLDDDRIKSCFNYETRDFIMETYTTKSAIDYKNISVAVIQKYPRLTEKQGFELISLSTPRAQCFYFICLY